MDNSTNNDSRSMEIAEGLLMGDELSSERQSMQENFMVELMGTLTSVVQEVGQIKQELAQLQGGANNQPTATSPVNPQADQNPNNGILETLTSKLGMQDAVGQ